MLNLCRTRESPSLGKWGRFSKAIKISWRLLRRWLCMSCHWTKELASHAWNASKAGGISTLIRTYFSVLIIHPGWTYMAIGGCVLDTYHKNGLRNDHTVESWIPSLAIFYKDTNWQQTIHIMTHTLSRTQWATFLSILRHHELRPGSINRDKWKFWFKATALT